MSARCRAVVPLTPRRAMGDDARSYWDAFVAWLRALFFGREMEIVVIGASSDADDDARRRATDARVHGSRETVFDVRERNSRDARDATSRATRRRGRATRRRDG